MWHSFEHHKYRSRLRPLAGLPELLCTQVSSDNASSSTDRGYLGNGTPFEKFRDHSIHAKRVPAAAFLGL